MHALAILTLLSQAPSPQSRCTARVPQLLYDRLVDLPAANSVPGLTLEKLHAAIEAEAAKLCVKSAPVFLKWLEWDDSEDLSPYPKQKELDAWLNQGVRAVVLALNDGRPDPETLKGEALCHAAIKTVASGLHAESEPIDDSLQGVWLKKWPVTAVAKFYTEACKGDRLPATHRTALVCYARCRGHPQRCVSACDADAEPPLYD